MRSEPKEKLRFIGALRQFARYGGVGIYDPIHKRPDFEPEYRGDRVLARALADYLDDPSIPGDSLGLNWYYDIGRHLVDAFEQFRTHPKWDALRKAYADRTEGEEVPDLINVHKGGGHRQLVAGQVARLVTALSGETWVQPRLDAYFGAQQACIDQAWNRFVRIGYRELMPRIKEETHRGNRGEFGKTALLTYAMAGRVMFTFKRGRDKENVQVTYVADDSDMCGVRSGGNFPSIPFATCIEMIDEVSDNWNLKKMKKDTAIGMF